MGGDLKTRADIIREIQQLRQISRRERKRFLKDHQDSLDFHESRLKESFDDALAALRDFIEETSGKNELCAEATAALEDYLSYMRWTLGDLPFHAVAIKPDPAWFRKTMGACILVYMTGRLVDDLLDHHFLYRGEKPTLLASLSRTMGEGRQAENVTFSLALLVLTKGLSEMTDLLETSPAEARELLKGTLQSFQKVLVGVIMEQSRPEAWNRKFYDTLIELKNVDYWRILYHAIDPSIASPLYPFLCRFYTLAQKINDLQDHVADEARSQPNLIALVRREQEDADHGGPSWHEALEIELGEEIISLAKAAHDLPERERSIALIKWDEQVEDAVKGGYFADDKPGTGKSQPEALNLPWHAHLEQFLVRGGPESIEEVPCPVCGEASFHSFFHCRGFQIRRCPKCTHAYVSPRLSAKIVAALGLELDSPESDSFADNQRITAGFIADFLRVRSPGPRMLDLGFGAGDLMRTACARGFEVYGIDASPKLYAELTPIFGTRLARARIEDLDEIPWGAFDVVVMSHLLEHVLDPQTAMEKVFQKIIPSLTENVNELSSVVHRMKDDQ